MNAYTDYWVDGHCITATDEDNARAWCIALYNHDPETIRPWTPED